MPLVDRVDHRFLAVNVLARLERLDGNAPVPVVRGRDDYRIHIAPRQDLAVIARGKEVGAPLLFGSRQAAVVEIADCDQFVARDRARVLGVARAHAPGADDGELDVAILHDGS